MSWASGHRHVLDRVPASVERRVPDPKRDRAEHVRAAAEDPFVGRGLANDGIGQSRNRIGSRSYSERARRMLLCEDGLQRARGTEDRFALRPCERRGGRRKRLRRSSAGVEEECGSGGAKANRRS